MSPFDLRGPQFLLFYLVLGVVTIVVLWWLRTRREGGEPPALDVSDAYLLAYLRGGANHACSVATISLVDRGLLELSGENHLKARSEGSAYARHPIEKAILEHFRGEGKEAKSIFTETASKAACQTYREKLTQLGLLPDAHVWRSRAGMLVAALAFLWLVAGTKVVVALARGRRNVLFLLFLAMLLSVVAGMVTLTRRTAMGTRLLADLGRLFEGLKTRASTIVPGGASNEAALLAAVFGLALLPADGYPYVKKLYPQASSSTTSSCGTSCGSSGGSSCGGGGGGGCGGCGG